ncbi:MAG TPA: hypothetical protein VGX70_23660 [Gemmataceae bacterium]|nr:hypothetical protein [Gemmataceae bacterium]
MPKLTCYQCRNAFGYEEPFCPHCGAVRKENSAQAGIRLVQRFVKGAVMGAGFGVGFGLVASVVYIIYGHIFKSLAAGFELDTIKMLGGIGLVCGVLIGGVAKIVRDLVKEE